MERLSGLDAAFIYIENPSHHMHVSMVSVFDPAGVPGGCSFDKVKGLILARMPRTPLFRRRLVEVPFRLHFPVWVQDPDFDIDLHVTHVTAPAPGGLRQLCDIASDFTSRQLRRDRPLWEMLMVDGLEGGCFGLLAKVHHAMIDGASGAELMVHLFDLEPDPAPNPIDTAPEPEPERIPSNLELVSYAAWSLAQGPANLAKVLPATVRSVRDLLQVRRDSDGPNMPVPFTAPRTPFNAAITPNRSVAVANLHLDDLKTVRRAFGTTVNDVVLALVGGALRRYLDGLGELPEQPLIAVVPISVRSETTDPTGAGPDGSNQVSAMFASLGTDVADPVERLRVIGEITKGAKEEHKAIGADLLQDWAQFAAPAVFARASAMYTNMKLASRHRPIHNVIVSNVPGPPFPLYLAGARLDMLCPLGPVMEGAGLNVTVLSNMGRVDVGLIACSELIPDLWDLAHAFDEAMTELLEAAEAAPATGRG